VKPPFAVPAVLTRHAALVAFALGLLQALAFAPFELWPLAPLCTAALFLLWDGVAPRRAAAIGFAFCAGLFLAGTYWLYVSVHVFGQAPLAIAIFLMLGLVAIMASYAALVGYALARWCPTPGLVRWLLVLPGAWVLMEWARGFLLSGFPWLALGYAQLDTWLQAYAPVGGVYGVSLLSALTAGALLALACGTARQRWIAAITTLAIWAGGAGLGQVQWTHPVGEPLKVSLVQGSIPQDLKWLEDNREATFKLYRSLNERAWGSRIIVWPEAALPVLYHEAVPFLQALYDDAQRRGADIVMGMLRYDPDAGQYRNGLLVMGERVEWYYKRRLVPFGEFFPVPKFIREWMRLKSLAYVDFIPGAAQQPALDVGGQKLGATICYEDAYASDQLAVLREATLLVNVSNDAWFGDSTAPHQHLEITRMRALEAGRWMMRATNNGVSALIAPDGRVAQQIPQFVAEVLTGEVQPYAGLTPYARVGNWPVILLAFAGVVVGLLSMRTAGRRV
jgi:apolipoprotein N-acyltransferase